jgi:hypothetical protein
LLLPNILNDQKEIWTFPVKLAQGKHLITTAAVLGTTAALTVADPYEASYFRRTSGFHWLNSTFTGNATAIGTNAAPISLYVAGLIRKDVKMQHTALLVGEAVADSEVLTTVFKDATRRIRPAAVPPRGIIGTPGLTVADRYTAEAGVSPRATLSPHSRSLP